MKHEGPIFVKVKFNISDEKTAGHLKYIANRPGVEKAALTTDMAHMEYTGTRPRSTGLFGVNAEHPPTVIEAQKDIQDRDSQLSWRIIISLKEEDAKKLGYVGREAWEGLTRRIMDRFAQAVGFKTKDLEWVAAHHPEQGHPHVHVLAYPKDSQQLRRGQLSAAELRDFRKGVAQECFGPLRTQLAVERTLARNTMLDITKQTVQDIYHVERKTVLQMQIDNPIGGKLPPTVSTARIAELSAKLNGLAKIMPGKGRAALKFMPPAVKEEARNIADWLLSSKELLPVMEAYRNATVGMVRLYTNQPGRQQEALDKAHSDLRDRVANVLIKSTAATNRAIRIQSMATAQTFKQVFRVIDNERARAEAQAELAAMQAEERNRRKDNEYEYFRF